MEVPEGVVVQDRDHILVVTEGGKFTSVRLREVREVQPALRSGWSVVVLAHGHLVIQENRSAFVDRCSGLMRAVLEGNSAGIDRFFSPPLRRQD